MNKGLDALEIVKAAMLSSGNSLLNSLWDYTDVIEKELKALEIIKKEPFVAANWYLHGSYGEYKNAIEVVKITEDEWNIVKEALL